MTRAGSTIEWLPAFAKQQTILEIKGFEECLCSTAGAATLEHNGTQALCRANGIEQIVDEPKPMSERENGKSKKKK